MRWYKFQSTYGPLFHGSRVKGIRKNCKLAMLIDQAVDRYGNKIYLADAKNDSFVHFTTRNMAEQILRTKILLESPPYKWTPISDVFAVSTTFGHFYPSVQTSHIKGDGSGIVALIFTTSKDPVGGGPEEVFWRDDVPLDDVRMVSYEDAIGILHGDTGDEDFRLYYDANEFNRARAEE